jgi:hypothetical protein
MYLPINKKDIVMRDICISVFLLLINAGAYSQWSADPSENTRVTNGGLLQQIITDGSGGAYVVYQDSPALLRQVWVQSLDKFGYLRFPDNGIRLSSADRYQSPYYYLVSDSVGGIIVLFEERHLVGDPFDEITFDAIYAQRIDSSGTKLWGDTGIEISPFVEGKRKAAISACSDGANGAFVFWGEDADNNGAFELWVQRITAEGQFAWNTGTTVTNKFIFDNTSNPNPSVSDGVGNGIILYSDSSDTKYDTKMQKIKADGGFLWAEGMNIYPIGRQMESDNLSGAIIAGALREFDGMNVKYVVKAQRVDLTGKVLWAEEGVAVDSLDDRTNPEIAVNKNSELAFVWQQPVNDTLNVFLNRIEKAGNVVFPEELEVSKFKSRKVAPQIVSSTSSSDIVIWYDYRNENGGLFSPDALFAQKIDGNGTSLWEESDIKISTSKVQHRDFHVISDLAGGAIVCWYETGVGSGFGIFAQQVSRDGNLGEVLVTSVSLTDQSHLPTQFVLHQSYPNPFNAKMVIGYEIPESNQVTLTIHDISGKEVITLINKNQSPGTYQATWNGKNQKGGDVASGIYIYQLRAGSFVSSKKGILIK